MSKNDISTIIKVLKDVLQDSNKHLLHGIRKEIRYSVQELKQTLEEKINLLPTKDEHFQKMDEMVTELQKTRDEQIVMRGQIEDHEERLSITEARLKIPQR